jgi:hypothetical protein
MQPDEQPHAPIGKRYIAALEAKHIDWLCPICHHREWEPLLNPRVMPSISSTGEPVQAGPVAAAVECLVCGSVQFFNPWRVID